MSNNKRRLLSLIQILKTETDRNNPLKESQIKELLNKEGLNIHRETLYEDIETLIDYDYEVYYDTYKKAYYLEDAPFSLAETKILIDSISVINLDSKSKAVLTNKLLSFISKHQIDLIKRNQVVLKEKTKNTSSYINNLDIILNSINNTKYVELEYHESLRTVKPHFIYFSNSRYYLFVTYKENDNIYSYRVDRITKIKELSESYEYSSQIIEKIKKRIKTSYGNLDKNSPEIIQLETNDYESIRDRLEDDFPNHYVDNKGNIVIEYRPNEQFFSKIVSYSNLIKIKAPLNVKEAYLKYLKNIIKNY